MGDRIIDLRSDTVTLPSDEMRRAIADAPVGDDVFGEDPTIRRLEAMAAERTGKEAALFVASGTMSNLVAIMAHCGRGDEAIVGSESHILQYEVAGAAGVAGVQLRAVTNDARGASTPPKSKRRSVAKTSTLPRRRSSASRTRTTAGAARRSRRMTSKNWPRSHIVTACGYTSTAPASSTRQPRSGRASPRSLRPLTRSDSACRRGSVRRSDRCCAGRASSSRGRARCARWSAAACGRAASSPLPACTRSSTWWSAWPTITRTRSCWRADWRSCRWSTWIADTIDTNIVIFGVRGDWLGFARSMKQAGVLSTITAPGRLRMVTHYGIERADIDEALQRVRHAAAALA